MPRGVPKSGFRVQRHPRLAGPSIVVAHCVSPSAARAFVISAGSQ
jgi:hypothetical protein